MPAIETLNASQQAAMRLGIGIVENSLNITKFGAVGDGIVDCTSALNDALAASQLQKLPIYFPPGVYLVSKITASVENVTMFGSPFESTLKLKNNENGALLEINGAKAVILSNLSFDGNASNQEATTQEFVNITAGVGSQLTFVKDCSFKDSCNRALNISTGASGSGFSFADVLIDGCLFDSVGEHGSLLDCEAIRLRGSILQARITNCNFTDCSYGDGSKVIGITAEVVGSEWVENVIISNININGCGSAIFTQKTRSLVVDSVNVKNVAYDGVTSFTSNVIKVDNQGAQARVIVSNVSASHDGTYAPLIWITNESDGGTGNLLTPATIVKSAHLRNCGIKIDTHIGNSLIADCIVEKTNENSSNAISVAGFGSYEPNKITDCIAINTSINVNGKAVVSGCKTAGLDVNTDAGVNVHDCLVTGTLDIRNDNVTVSGCSVRGSGQIRTNGVVSNVAIVDCDVQTTADTAIRIFNGNNSTGINILRNIVSSTETFTTTPVLDLGGVGNINLIDNVVLAASGRKLIRRTPVVDQPITGVIRGNVGVTSWVNIPGDNSVGLVFS